MLNKSTDQEDRFSALIGLDWGDCSHAVALFAAGSDSVESSTLVQTAEAVRAWIKDLEKRFGGKPVAIALETSKGALIHMFFNVPWLTIFPIHPATSARYRKAFSPSGAKDDAPDALILLDLLRNHRNKLRSLVVEDDATRKLAGLCELRRKSVDRRTGLTNAIRSLLKGYFPQALKLIGETLHSPLALAFLQKWPDLISLKSAKSSTIKSFFHRHNVRRPETIQDRLKIIEQAVALTTDEAIVAVSIRQLRRLVEEVEILQRHIIGDEKEIAAQFKAHPDADLFAQLPGAGATLGPRLLVGFGTDRTRYADAGELARYSGVAPVKEKSGGRVWIHWRWNAPWFLRQSLIEWAGQSILYCAWARAYYDQQKSKGKGHWACVRSLAYKWIRILWKCWQTHEPYCESTYLEALEKRKSNLLSHAK